MSPTFVPGEGSSQTKLLILGEAPGRFEDEAGRPFVGPAGQVLDSWLYNAGISRDEVYITNVLKYQPPQNDFKRLSEIGLDYNKCVAELWLEIKAINPNCILALGAHALEAVTEFKGITKYRGSILPSIKGFPKVVPTFHPAAFMYSDEIKSGGKAKYSYIHICKLDMERALEESKTRDFNLPKRNLWFATNAYQVMQFFERFKDKRRAAVDVETYKQGVTCVGIAFNSYEGCSIPLVQTLKGLRISQISDSDLVLIWRMLDEFFRNDQIEKIGQNFKFDHEKLQDLGFRIAGKVHDNRLIAHTIQPEYPAFSQQFFTSIYTREPYYKDEYKNYDPKRDRIDTVLLYNAKDAVTEFEIFEKLIEELNEDPIIANFYHSFVQQLHQLYLDIESVGFDFDLGIRDNELLPKYNKLITDTEHLLFKLAGQPFNINSPKQVAHILYDILSIPRRKSTDEDTLVALLANVVKKDEQRRFIETLLTTRRYRKSVSTYIDIKLDYDGRLRTSFNITGAETGRSSTSKPDEPVRPEGMGLALQTLTKRGIGKDIRRAIKPWKNHVLVEIDYRNAEGWITSLLANDLDLLEFMKLGGDSHRLRASWFCGGKDCSLTTIKDAVKLLKDNNPIIQMKDIDDLERYLGKKGGHGGSYGEGKRTLMIDINSEAYKNGIDLNISEWRAGKILDKFHQYSPNIREVYHYEVQECLNRNKILYNPFGRRRTFLSRDDDNMYREGYANLPQSTVPDALRMACLRALKIKPLKIVHEWHDSAILMSEKNSWREDAEILYTEMIKPINFEKCSLPRSNLIIPAEIKLFENDWSKGEEITL